MSDLSKQTLFGKASNVYIINYKYKFDFAR